MSKKTSANNDSIGAFIIIMITIAFFVGYAKVINQYGSVGQWIFGPGDPVAPRPARNVDSFVGCKMAIEDAALDRSEVEVPLLAGQKRSDNTWEYYWGASTKPLRLPNSLGMSLIVEGACIADQSGEVISLTLNGDRVK